ncbi:MAG: hypothetical protein WC797_04565 [Candidatus Paceibacterota bacterium]|jgi:hypothetical protein
MPELISANRGFFPKGRQSKFLNKIKAETGLSNQKLAATAGVHLRTFSDWKREKNSVSLQGLRNLCDLAKLPLPKDVISKPAYWYTHMGGKTGAKVLFEKYGKIPVNEKYRNKKWREWWDREGKFKNVIFTPKKVTLPRHSPHLAEFFGIMIGDGGITRYQIGITLNSETDKDYSLYVTKLIEELFKVKVSKYARPHTKALLLRASGKELVNFLNTNGLHTGNKLAQNLNIPNWIMNNKSYRKACLRGLLDTDGSLFYEKHCIKNKVYEYARLNFVTASPALANSVVEIMASLKLEPKLRRDGKAVQIENKTKIGKYFETVGTSNLKHLQRWQRLN